MRRRPTLLLAALAAALTGAPDAFADEPRRIAADRLSAPAGLAEDACLTGPASGAGVARQAVAVDGPGTVTVRTRGAGDWDVALLDAGGRALGAGASPDADEVASGVAVRAGTLTVQACRVGGDAADLAVTVDHQPLPERTDDGPVQLVDVLADTPAERSQVAELGLDLTEHAGEDGVGVVLHSDADRQTLLRNGFKWRIVEDDLVATDRANRLADARFAARRAGTGLPSARTAYRTLADYESEMKALAAANPGLVKLITLPEKSVLGRDVLGLEIAEDVEAKDGKPAFFNMGVHHAREWPAGEMAMEWAYELVNGYKAGEPRATNVVKRSRNIVVPIVNVDGFNSSRSAPTAMAGGTDESIPDTVSIVSRPLEYRRKNCNSGVPDCGGSVGLAENGVDNNRNYGALWGGPGADQTNPLAQTFPGAGPFSEPETRNVRAVVASNQVMSLITNHTTAGLVLRAPGIASLGDSVDETIYKALGDAMAKENGYFSQKSFELYDTTGTTEDWSYNVTGGLGFTFEIYCGTLNYGTGDCDDPAFHPTFQRVVEEWEGTSPQADHTQDPADPHAGYDGKGNREAYYLAAESAIDEARHAVLEGAAPAGATLRVKKQFQTETFPQADGQPRRFEDTLESTYTVPAGGRYRWHVNPSTRPIVAKATGDPEGGQPSPGQSFAGSGAATPPGQFDDIPFTVPADGGGVKNRGLELDLTWATPASDWDLTLYEAKPDGTADTAKQVATSATGPTTSETLSIVPVPGKAYVARVTNFLAVPVLDDYTLKLTYAGPPPFQAAQRESYTMTCEVAGKVVETKAVFVDRGQVVGTDFPACSAEAARLAGGGAGAPAPDATPAATACVASNGLRSVGATPRRRGVRFDFRRRVGAPVAVDVFRQSAGRRVLGEQLVARFAARKRAFTWNGKATRKGRRVGDGFYFARYRIRTPQGPDTRRLVLRRADGRFRVVRSGFHRRASCGLIRGFKLGRPVFGGSNRRTLGIAVRPSRAATVRVTVLRGSTVVRRYRAVRVRAGRTARRTLAPKGLRRGPYRIRAEVRVGKRTVRSTLTARRL